MYAVGKLGSYISQGVYTVSGPFHPFGGAVDIIVVQQPDGSFRSSPWYVKFGKFQGVLKSKEKIVKICVNDVDAAFHMYLDHKGEAYFLSEAEEADAEEEKLLKKSMSCNYDDGNEKIVERTSSRRSRVFGLMFGGRSLNGKDGKEDSLERAEIAVDLLETRWSTNLPGRSPRDEESNGIDDTIAKDMGDLLDKDHDHDHVVQVPGIADDEIGDDGMPAYMIRSETSEEVVKIPCFENGGMGDKDVLVSESVSCKDVLVSESVSCKSEQVDYNYQVTAIANNDINDNISTDTVRKEDDEEVVKIRILETVDKGEKDEVVSQSVAIESEAFNYNHDVCVVLTGELRSSEAVEKSPANDETDYKSQSDVHVREVGLTLESGECTNNNRNCNGFHNPEIDISGAERSSAFQEASNDPACSSNSEATIANGSNEYVAESKLVNQEQSTSAINSPHFPLLEKYFISDVRAQDVKCQDESQVMLSENVDDDVFSFCDIAGTLPVDATAHVDDSMSVPEVEAKTENVNHEKESKVSSARSSPICISMSKTHFEGGLLTNSLPIIHSHNNVIDHPLSQSFDVNSERYNDNLVKKKSPSKLQEDYNVSAAYCENGEGLQASFLGPDAEQSLSKNSLFEGVEADAASTVVNAEKDGKMLDMDPSRATLPPAGSWSIWSLGSRKPKPVRTACSTPESAEKADIDAALIRSQSLTIEDGYQSVKALKKNMRSPTPTSEDLASLNLKEGRNMITFTFSTAMLGQQQVDARIYLWKWNTRIVISDVDGTITKSDVLGQFMPLVGIDWYQTGVAHLFSAIKENGYEMLFLSARAISQAHLTRQFLFNLRQDGKLLPDGPVIISPDGLFPSLFREVIRRVPHEFKISCLETIRALFPPECNPFYAGFGNRDTDEISYLKVGIPKGKIFIINPKGEVVMNRRVQTKSYSTLHALVHDMFPPASSAEQEDFNSWNYWKLPLPEV